MQKGKPAGSSGAQQQSKPLLDADGMVISKPLHRFGMYNDSRLENTFRRRVDRLVDAPPNMFSRRVHVFTYAIMFVAGTYVAMYQDFGDREHCFSSLRRWYFRKLNSWWSLSTEEEKELRERGRLK
ncbi:hypothetical protein GGH99_003335 [Coemansia sp. RSA 1285]|nr:hypothetical protein EV177_005543 [Coemansia sp. RSA 1804]KAJ2687079.1 hypothetical protein GGH99_003335 [Coemansia sp. RSA 1285]